MSNSNGPSLLVRPNNPLGTAKRGTGIAVVVAVDNDAKFATVAVDNNSPFESGYGIAAGMGPWAAAGTAGFNWFFNNSSGVGGSIVNVDLDQRQILTGTGSISTVSATPYYAALSDHQHNGLVNPDNGILNPNPVALSGGQSSGNLPYGQNSGAIMGVINSEGNVISTEFPGELVLMSSGQYAGLYEQVETSIYGSVPFGMAATGWLWMDWQSLCTTPTTATWGPSITDKHGHTYTVAFNGTTGSLLKDGTAVASLLASPTDSSLHILTIGVNYIGGTAFRIVVTMDGNIPVVDYTDTAGDMNAATIYPGFVASAVDIVYHRSFDFYGATTGAQLLGNPDPTAPPQLISPAPAITRYIGAGDAGAYDAEVTFATAIGLAPWLGEVRVYVVPVTPGVTPTSVLSNPDQAIFKTAFAPKQSGQYTTWAHGLSAGTSYALYAVFFDLRGEPSSGAYLVSTDANPQTIGANNLASMPPNTTPSVISQGEAIRINDGPNNTAFDFIILDVVLDANGIAANPWIAAIELVYESSGTSTVKYSNTVAVQEINDYELIWPALPLGVAQNGTTLTYNLGFRYVDFAGNRSNTYIFESSGGSALTVGTPSLSTIPPGTNFSVTNQTETSLENNGGSTFTAQMTFDLTITVPNGAAAPAQFLDKIYLLAKEQVQGVSDTDTTPEHYARVGWVAGGEYGGAGSRITTTFGPLGNNAIWQLALQLCGHDNDVSDALPIYLVGQQNSDAYNTPGASNTNFIGDSDMQFTAGNGASTYWTYAGWDPTRFHVILATNGGVNMLDCDAHGGAPVGAVCGYSDLINVISGQPYTFSIQANLDESQSGAQYFGIVNLSDKTANHVTPSSVYQSASLPRVSHGQPGRPAQLTWTATLTGQIACALWATNITGSCNWSHPQFELGSTATAYKSGTLATNASSTLAHGAQSQQVQATIDAAAGLNVSNANAAYGTLPQAAHSLEVRDVIGTGSAGRGALSVSPPGGVSGNVPYDNNSTAVQTVVSSSGDLLASDFPGLTIHQTTGTYAGWELVSPTAITSLSGVFVGSAARDSKAYSIPVGSTLWQTWTINLDTAGAIAAPFFQDSSSSPYTTSVENNAGRAFILYNSAIAGANYFTATTADTQAHTYITGLQNLGAGQWRVISYVDGTKIADKTFPAAYTNPFYPGIYHFNGGNLYVRDYAVQVGDDTYEQLTGAAKAVIDISGNLLASDFPGQTVHQTTGPYAGWELVNQGGNLVGFPLPLAFDSKSYSTPSGGSTLWAQWSIIAPGGITVRTGFVDSSGPSYALALDIAPTGVQGYILHNGGVAVSLNSGPSSGVADGAAHTVLCGVQQISPSIWRFVVYVDGLKVHDYTTGSFGFYSPWYPYMAATAAGQSLYIRDYEIQVGGQTLDTLPTAVQQTQNPNLLKNGNFARGSGTSYGWSPWATGPAHDIHEGQYGKYGESLAYTIDHILGPAPGYGITQVISVKPHTTYSFAGLLFCPSSNGPANVYMWVGDTSYSVVQLNAAPGVISGSVPNFYAMGVQPVVLQQAAATGNSAHYDAWVLVSGTFNTGNYTQIAVLLYSANGGSATEFFSAGNMIWEGDKWQDYADGDPLPGPLHYGNTPTAISSVITSGGTIPTSTALNAQYSLVAIPDTTYIEAECSSTGIDIRWTQIFIYFPDGHVINTGSGDQGFSGLQPSTAYVFQMYFNGNTGMVYVNLLGVLANYGGTPKPTLQQLVQANADGCTPISNGYIVTTPPDGAFGSSGPPPQNTCPSVDQLVRTKEHGYIRAGDISVGDHVYCTPKGKWVPVLRKQIVAAFICKIKLGSEEFEVDMEHRVLRFGGDPSPRSGDWIPVYDLTRNTLVQGLDDIPISVRSIGEEYPGQYAELTVEGNVYDLGSTVVHNVYTGAQ